MFKLTHPSASDIESFHREGYIAFSNAMEDDYREALIEEVLSPNPILDFLSLSEEENDNRAVLPL
jgi:hypothetical protein